MIVGNLTRDPELRCTPDGTSVCSFTVAVNRRARPEQNQEADFFNVSAWRELGENCAKFLAKGKKVCVIGPVSCRAFARNDGSLGASMEIRANDVEFLSPKSEGDRNGYADEYSPVDVPQDELPFNS